MHEAVKSVWLPSKRDGLGVVIIYLRIFQELNYSHWHTMVLTYVAPETNKKKAPP